MLLYLGIKDVKVINVNSFKGKNAFGEREDVDDVPIWLPKVKLISRRRQKIAAASRGTRGAIQPSQSAPP